MPSASTVPDDLANVRSEGGESDALSNEYVDMADFKRAGFLKKDGVDEGGRFSPSATEHGQCERRYPEGERS